MRYCDLLPNDLLMFRSCFQLVISIDHHDGRYDLTLLEHFKSGTLSIKSYNNLLGAISGEILSCNLNRL